VMRVPSLIAIALVLGGCATAAPVIPHAITQTSEAWCASCHLKGEQGAPATPHPERLNCVGCHEPVGTADVGAWAPLDVVLRSP
ncbi:MAG: hypothetical protein OES13_10610, partial [Acidimicrobiia bacterium]|nr:hypothetical protein [Acidimicrobiia bacterium]